MAKNKLSTYTVSEVTTLVKVALEGGVPSRFTVLGEISGWKHYGSGHCYFSLKDEGSILPCVMWKSKFSKTKFAPENGMSVLATGNVDIYEPQGKYQFYVDRLVPGGVGQLQLAFEEMVKRLRAEGLFEDEHKKAIPAYPMRIGIVTSESGAAVMDIADSIYNRWPCAKLLLYPVRVQGDGAADEIATAIRKINRGNSELRLDVLIVGRGGGSLEDLWAFNEEVVARAIFKSEIPVISAVGHEVDVSIADLVADARASTPTKAGMIAVPDMVEVLERIAEAQNRLRIMAAGKVELCGQGLETVLASSAFKNPYLIVNNADQRVDELSGKIGDSARRMFSQLLERLRSAYEKIARIEPHRLLGLKKVELNGLVSVCRAKMTEAVSGGAKRVEGAAGGLERAFGGVIAKKKLQITALDNRLRGLDPKSVLGRGYSITTNKSTGKVVTSVEDVMSGAMLVTEVADRGLIESEVKSAQKPNNIRKER